MAHVEVKINGRGYEIACDNGQEEHVAELGDFLDRKVAELAVRIGQVGDSRLLVMAALLNYLILMTKYLNCVRGILPPVLIMPKMPRQQMALPFLRNALKILPSTSNTPKLDVGGRCPVCQVSIFPWPIHSPRELSLPEPWFWHMVPTLT